MVRRRRVNQGDSEHSPVHEFSIACRLIEVVETELLQLGANGRAVSVAVTVGELSGVVPEALQFAFAAASEGTRLAGACLSISEIPLRLRCGACGTEWHPHGPFLLCGTCGGTDVSVQAGDELRVTSVEIEDGPSL